jgi:hypothetical protein
MYLKKATKKQKSKKNFVAFRKSLHPDIPLNNGPNPDVPRIARRT